MVNNGAMNGLSVVCTQEARGTQEVGGTLGVEDGVGIIEGR